MAKASVSKQHNTSQSPFYPPVVAVLGHIDHGKTTLLDAIAKTTIAAHEEGGITQKIGASSVLVEHEGVKRTITFIDTPGHEAFIKMRGRGVVASDIGILVVSSVDGIKPQTQESITVLKNAKVPFIVVLTKTDLPTKNPQKVKQQLLQEDVMVEGMGGEVPVVEVSAKEGSNIKELLELILLVYDMREQAEDRSEKGKFAAVVIESKLDTKAGPRATLVIKNGSVAIKDELICEDVQAKVKTIVDDKGAHLTYATIGQAVELLGFDKVPKVGGVVYKKKEAVLEEKEAGDVALSSQKLPAYSVFQKSEEKHLSVVLCADTEGSLEAVVSALPKEINIVIQKSGEISEADILFAKSTGAVVLGFNLKIRNEILVLAKVEKVLLKNYTVIYELINEAIDVLEGKKLALVQEVLGKANILASFPFEKTKVMGIKVLEGRIARGDKVRLIRDNTELGQGTITSVRQGKNTVSKIEGGGEGGVIISPSLDFTIGDMLLCQG